VLESLDCGIIIGHVCIPQVVYFTGAPIYENSRSPLVQKRVVHGRIIVAYFYILFISLFTCQCNINDYVERYTSKVVHRSKQ